MDGGKKNPTSSHLCSLLETEVFSGISFLIRFLVFIKSLPDQPSRVLSSMTFSLRLLGNIRKART